MYSNFFIVIILYNLRNVYLIVFYVVDLVFIEVKIKRNRNRKFIFSKWEKYRNGIVNSVLKIN